MERFADGQAFGEAGSYLRIKGIAKGEIDPAAPENRVITDLNKAPRNAHGMVEYESDFFVLRLADLRRANSVLVYDVTNRGRKMILNLLDDASGDADTNNPKRAQDVGSGFTLSRGYSLVWSGWDSGAPRANNGVTRGCRQHSKTVSRWCAGSVTSSISAHALRAREMSCG